MLIDKFKFEGKDFGIEMIDNQYLVFYQEKFDSFSWFAGPDEVTSITNDIHNPVALFRIIAIKVQKFLYGKHIKYFYLTVSDKKRKRIYIHFLQKLKRYSFQVTDNTINVFITPTN